MASLTPLSKGLIGLAVIGAVASAIWHLGLKERLGGGSASATSPAATPAVSPAPTIAATVSDVPTPVTAPPVSAPVAAPASSPTSRLSAAEHSELGRKLLDRGNFAEARVHLEQAVQGGDGAAACHLGEMTLKGQGGIAPSQDKAAALFRTAQSRNIICFASGN